MMCAPPRWLCWPGSGLCALGPIPAAPSGSQVVLSKIRAVLGIAVAHQHRVLILGAWGCGAFGNPAAAVAGLFRRLLLADGWLKWFDVVLFAVPDPAHYQAFAQALPEAELLGSLTHHVPRIEHQPAPDHQWELEAVKWQLLAEVCPETLVAVASGPPPTSLPAAKREYRPLRGGKHGL